jgi:hypothetical protein
MKECFLQLLVSLGVRDVTIFDVKKNYSSNKYDLRSLRTLKDNRLPLHVANQLDGKVVGGAKKETIH